MAKAIDPGEPWCATEVHPSDNTVKEGKWGVCAVNILSVDIKNSSCPISPPTCGVPVRTRTTPEALNEIKKKLGNKNAISIFDTDILQMPWMVTIGKYTKQNRIGILHFDI